MPRKELEALAAFTTEAQRRIRSIENTKDWEMVQWWALGAPEYKRLPDGSVADLLAQLEAKRVEVLRKSGALQ